MPNQKKAKKEEDRCRGCIHIKMEWKFQSMPCRDCTRRDGVRDRHVTQEEYDKVRETLIKLR